MQRLSYILILLGLASLHAQLPTLNFDSNGNLNVNVAAGGGAGGTSSTFGAAFPGTGTAAGFKDGGGNMQPGLLDGSNFLEVDCKAGCSGAAGDTTASGTLAALNNTVVMAMAGVSSASFSLPATKIPDKVYETEAQTVAWVFKCGNMASQ